MSNLKYQCRCNKTNCILKSFRIFDQYRNKKELSQVVHHDDATDRKIYFRERTICIDRFNTDIKINGPKCSIIKHLLRATNHINDTTHTNNDLYKDWCKLSTAFDSEVIRGKKCIELATKNITEVANLQKQIIYYQNIERDKNAEIRKLKKANNRLSTALINVNDVSDVNDVNDVRDVSDDENYIIDSPSDGEDIKDTLDVIYTYQNIRDYMDANNISLDDVCRRNGIIGFNRRDLYNAYLNKKLRRIEICHPNISDIDRIENDDDFINVILS